MIFREQDSDKVTFEQTSDNCEAEVLIIFFLISMRITLIDIKV
jgi:hypothetical protein